MRALQNGPRPTSQANILNVDDFQGETAGFASKSAQVDGVQWAGMVC